MREASCVGALIKDEHGRVFAHRRTLTRRLFPGVWDIPGGHVETGETWEEALAREVEEETGWRLRGVQGVLADWEWEHDGVVRHELDFLVEVDGDLNAPRLEEGKQDAHAWVGHDDLDLMMVGRTDGDRRLRDVVAKAVRTRLNDRLRLEPIGPEHAGDVRRLHRDRVVAEWYAGAYSTEEEARRFAAVCHEGWESEGVHKWIAYDRKGGELVGRGGLSRVAAPGAPYDGIRAALPRALGQEWAAQRLELGWAVREPFQRQGYATEIGRAGLDFAFGPLGATVVVAFTERHNVRSRAVMERLDMTYAGEFPAEGWNESNTELLPDAPFALYVLEAGRTGRGAAT